MHPNLQAQKSEENRMQRAALLNTLNANSLMDMQKWGYQSGRMINFPGANNRTPPKTLAHWIDF